MTQDFVGANNLPHFTKEGQFGTRYHQGHNAAQVRYLYTRPNPVISYIYRKEKDILELDVDEGELIEPKFYLPIIPMVLMNGTRGVATGHSSYIPCHNPIEVIDWLLNHLNIDDPEDGQVSYESSALIPWYKDWTGSITLAPKKTGPVEQPEDPSECYYSPGEDHQPGEDQVDGDASYQPGASYPSGDASHCVMQTEGRFKVAGSLIIIDELPIGHYPESYRRRLDRLIEEKQLTRYRDNSCDNKVYFELTGFKQDPTMKSLLLNKITSLSNMVLLNPDTLQQHIGNHRSFLSGKITILPYMF